jgi:hypothetical protein
MSEAIVKIGRPDSWWNRKVPIMQISFIVVALLVGFYTWLAYGDLIHSTVWGVRHRRMASFRGQTLQVPWFWQEEDWANYNEFELTRSYSGFTVPSKVTVKYEDSAPRDVQKIVERLRSSAQANKIPGWFYNDYEGDDFSRGHYLCLEQGAKGTAILAVDCFSRDGHWSVRIFGLKQTRREFQMILRGVDSMGTPTK